MLKGLLHGLAAGAAGTTALNGATYLDMAWRGRPASSTPEQTAEKLADLAGHPVKGEGETRENRLTGLGALSGIATGVGIGALFGLARSVGIRPGPVVGAVLAGGAAMLASDGTMTALKVTDPKTWSATDWASDALPHLAYGLVTMSSLTAMDKWRP